MSASIAVIIKSLHQLEVIHSVIQEKNYDAAVYCESSNAACIEKARRCAEAGAKVIVAPESVSISVREDHYAMSVPLYRSAFSFARRLHEVLKVHDHVAALYRETELRSERSYGSAVRSAAALFPERVSVYSVDENSLYDPIISDLRLKDITAVVGPSWALPHFDASRFAQYAFPLAREDAASILEEADRLLQTYNSAEKNAALLDTILNSTQSAIITFSREGRILQFNQKAQLLLPDLTGSAEDPAISEAIFRAFRIGDAFEAGFESQKHFVTAFGSSFLVSIQSILVEEKASMAVASFETTDEIQENEQRTRASYHKAGNIAYKTFNSVIGHSQSLRAVIQEAKRYSKVNSTILITGPSGVGKELFAQSIHNESPRNGNPFVVINCAALPESILESILFGYSKGSFTGAQAGGKAGLFEIAHGGTIFIDEISELPLSLQTRFLRVLQEREVMRIGADRAIPINVRIIAATNRDLRAMVDEGNFRADLYYRINVLRLSVPPLKERKEDIPELSRFFIRTHSAILNSSAGDITDEALALLQTHELKGNIRQLNNYLERAMVLSDDPVIRIDTMQKVLRADDFSPVSAPAAPVPAEEAPASSGKSLTRDRLLEALGHNHNDKTRTAAELGISTSTLWRKMKAWGLSTEK